MTQPLKPGSLALALGLCLTAQAAAPIIRDISMVQGSAQLLVQSDTGITNQILCKTNLNQSDWVTLTNLVVAQSPYAFVDVTSTGAPMSFYRVLGFPSTPKPLLNGMALIPAGSFQMGDNLDGDYQAVPVHTVYTSGFYIDTNLVSYAQWQPVFQWATNHGYSFDSTGSGKAPDHPVQTINWYDALKWCNARSEMEARCPAYYTSQWQTNVYRTGRTDVRNAWVKWDGGYRLPTEAEWEKAARGGLNGHRFPWGDTIDWSHANYEAWPEQYPYDINPTGGYNPAFNDGAYPYTSPVGYFEANGYGLCDMAGNVWQWCWDWYQAYSSESQSDPRGPTSGTYRVYRGGSWSIWAVACRTEYRYYWYPTSSDYSLGFRTVLALESPAQ